MYIPYITTIGGSQPICMWYLKRSTISNCCFILFFFFMIYHTHNAYHTCRNFTANKLYRSEYAIPLDILCVLNQKYFQLFGLSLALGKVYVEVIYPDINGKLKQQTFLFLRRLGFVELLCPLHIHNSDIISVHKFRKL